MGYDMTTLLPTNQDFFGIIPGARSTRVSRVTLPVTFGTQENYCTEYINFEVVAFETSCHAILRRPALTNFMAVPNRTYLVMKMLAPKGVFFVFGDLQTSYSCEMENINLSNTQWRNWKEILRGAETEQKF